MCATVVRRGADSRAKHRPHWAGRPLAGGWLQPRVATAPSVPSRQEFACHACLELSGTCVSPPDLNDHIMLHMPVTCPELALCTMQY
eukprot:6189463-Pleurochrysis_carterae.AAC.1